MAIRIKIPAALRGCTEGKDHVHVDGESVGEVMSRLTKKFSAIGPHLFDAGGNLRKFVNIFANGENIRYLHQEDTALQDGDELTIIPSVTGGSETPATEPRSGELSKEEIERYSRHLIMPEVALAGQMKLKKASILCIGTGGLGSPLTLYLAAAGIGRIGLVDFDVVDHTNLQRQILHGTSDVGRPKLDSAVDKLREINPYVQLDTYNTMFTADNALEIMEPYDIVVDGTDNFPTRYLVNDACVLLGKPNVYGSIFRFEGQASVFWADKGPCYRCLYPEPPPPGMVPSCAEGGVLGILPGLIGVIQATEAVKLILGKGETLVGRLLLYNAMNMSFRELKLRKDPQCPLCGDNPTVTELIDYDHFCGINTGQESPLLGAQDNLSAQEVKARLDSKDDVLLLDVREPHEYDICKLPNSKLIPLGQVEKRIGEIDRDADIIVYCRSGVRSAQAAKFLLDAGYRKVKNMEGGMLAWSDRVDPSVPKY